MARQPRKYFYDLHVHTSRYSPCSSLPPQRLIAAARARGLDGVLLAEHDRLWPAEELAALRGAAKEHDRETPFVIFSGAEIRTRVNDRATGDLIILGVRRLSAPPVSIDTVCKDAHEQGGIVIAPHPFAFFQGISDGIFSAAIDAVETLNFRYNLPQQARLAEAAGARLNIGATGGSDAHALDQLGRYCTAFDEPIADEDELIEAILARRGRPHPAPPPGRLRRWLGI